MPQKFSLYRFLFWLLVFWAMLGVDSVLPRTARAKTVALPLTIDYPLLRALVATTAFSGPGETVVVLNESGGCRRIVLSRPAYSGNGGLIRSEFHVSVLLGAEVGNNCLAPVNWEGFLVLRQQPRMDPGSWTLWFETLDSQVLDRQRRPAKLAGLLWELVQNRVYGYLADIRIPLAPPVDELKAFLGESFTAADQSRAQSMVASLRAEGVTADEAAVRVTLQSDVGELAEELAAEEAVALSDAELARFTANWESWDGYLVQILSSLAPRGLSAADRQVLLDTLLTSRHDFVKGLAEKSLSDDFVRAQFVQAWQPLSTVFRRHLNAGSNTSLLGYLAFFTASDALAALDQIGPTLGIDISRAGLMRLARLLGRTPAASLAYGAEVVAELRAALGLGPPLEAGGPAFDGDALERQWLQGPPMGRVPSVFLERIGTLFCPPAWAAKPKTDTLAEIRNWMAPPTPAAKLVERVRTLLDAGAEKTLKKRKTAKHYSQFFPRLAVATAWQESCFRQYLVKGDKVVYLRSYNGSSVGLMQINERVWRGIYDLNQLRWNIRYNALAGCEVLDLYVAKYIEGNPQNRAIAAKLKDDTLAGLVYAMYNGGPRDFDRFLKRSRSGKFHLSDRLFKEKYGWVKTGRWQSGRNCFGADAK